MLRVTTAIEEALVYESRDRETEQDKVIRSFVGGKDVSRRFPLTMASPCALLCCHTFSTT